MMINDSELIDQVNPFLKEPPGAWSKPYQFSLSSTDGMTIKETPTWETNNKDSCQTAATAGDNQVLWCSDIKPNCPIHRNLEPTQRADPDIDYPDDPGKISVEILPTPIKKINWNLMFVLLLLCIVLFIASQEF